MDSTPHSRDIRRMHERAALILEVSYRSTGGFLMSYSLNLSRGGMFIESDAPLAVGSVLTLRMNIPGDVIDKPREISGRVMWIREEENEEGRPGMGLAFDSVDETIGDLIDQLVSSFEGLHILLIGGKSGKSRSHLAGRLRSLLRGKIIEVGGKVSAIDQLAENVDLVVADLDRAGKEGIAFLHWASERLDKRVPLLALASTPEMRETAQKVGADEVVYGQGSPREFRMAVLRVISKPLVSSR